MKPRKHVPIISDVLLGISLCILMQGLITPPSVAISSSTTQSMNFWQALVLGFVQGMTEFLPISSTAHLKVVPVVLGWGDPGVTFTAVIQLGSIAAVLWYFWGDLTQITTGMFKAVKTKDYKSIDFRLAVGIILGSIPIIVFGLLLKVLVPDLDNSPLRSLTAIAIASIVMSILLGVAESITKKQRQFEQLTTRDGILMGIAQSLALIPGVSRSGSTMTAGLFMNLERSTAARFSFLLGIPAITLAGLVELKDVFEQQVSGNEIFPIIAGILSSAVFSYLSIAWLLGYLKNQNTWIFVWYRLAFGILILTGVAANWIAGIISGSTFS